MDAWIDNLFAKLSAVSCHTDSGTVYHRMEGSERNVPRYSEEYRYARKLWRYNWASMVNGYNKWAIFKRYSLRTITEGAETFELALCRAWLIEKMKEENNG